MTRGVDVLAEKKGQSQLGNIVTRIATYGMKILTINLKNNFCANLGSGAILSKV